MDSTEDMRDVAARLRRSDDAETLRRNSVSDRQDQLPPHTASPSGNHRNYDGWKMDIDPTGQRPTRLVGLPDGYPKASSVASGVELTEPERNQVAASLRETAARMERRSRGRDNAGPRYAGLRRMLRDEARAMRELAGRFDGSTR